jgi:hypothetical protein
MYPRAEQGVKWESNMKNEKTATRLVARQFATPLKQAEIDQVNGGEYSVDSFSGDGTCTHGNDGD